MALFALAICSKIQSSFGTIQRKWKATALCEFYRTRFKIAHASYMLLYECVLIVLEGTSSGLICVYVSVCVLQRDLNRFCGCCHVAKPYKRDMSDTKLYMIRPSVFNKHPFILYINTLIQLLRRRFCKLQGQILLSYTVTQPQWSHLLIKSTQLQRCI